VTISGKTCVLEKDNDPTILRSTSAGKLLRFLGDDGAHVNAGEVRQRERERERERESERESLVCVFVWVAG
jgi:hypothetical protein